MNFVASWSGGKDSCYAMMRAMKEGFVPKVLLTMMNENGIVSRSHGLPFFILNQQAQRIGVPLEGIPATWADYETKFITSLKTLKVKYALDAAVFGDIDLQSHKEWEEKVCLAAALRATLPLWQQDRISLVNEMLDAGIETMIVSCNTAMGEKYLGQFLTQKLAKELEQIGIDPCGENGEFHTLVVNCPLFSEAIQLPTYSRVTYENYCFIVWDEA